MQAVINREIVTDPNWKSQKTARKIRRRLSNAPKAVRKRMGFRGRRG